MLGSQWCLPEPPQGEEFRYQAVYSMTQNLANPVDLEGHAGRPAERREPAIRYYSFFDVGGNADDDYQSVGDHPPLVVSQDGDTCHRPLLTPSGY